MVRFVWLCQRKRIILTLVKNEKFMRGSPLEKMDSTLAPTRTNGDFKLKIGLGRGSLDGKLLRGSIRERFLLT